ncbi:hypothetical protein [Corynebacterium glutamicum]|uniref:hypothetical protein n=1 Tax=Corynebacterium glutamicum TaxID=1718 RepID=UPI0005C6A346|nr:hypothetical protein [Corynebacterium glutamicum]
MTKALADMTAEERQACVGMWANAGESLVIIGWTMDMDEGPCGVVEPRDIGLPRVANTDRVTPRFDLPRAWGPDGTPPKGKWCKRVLGKGRNQKSWVGEWEQTND